VIVLDASALLALVFQEAGTAVVERHLAESCMSTINLAEVLAKVARDDMDVAALRGGLERSAIEWVPFGFDDAEQAALLVPVTRAHGLSLGDRACLALAKARNVPVLTGDKAWAKVDVGVEIRLIR